MKKAIVIGALGFIGFVLCERLLEEEYEVIGIDHIGGAVEKLQEQKLAKISRNSQFVYINKQVEDIILRDLSEKSDYLYYCLLDDEVNEDNVTVKVTKSKIRLEAVMDYCTQIDCKFVHLSSYEVFQGNPALENGRKDQSPRNVIGKVKQEEEKEIYKYSRQNEKFSFFILQLPTVYGPWQPDTMTFQQLIMGVDSPLLDCIQEDAIFIKDLVEILIFIPNSSLENQTILISSYKENQWKEGFNLLNNKTNHYWVEGNTNLEQPNTNGQQLFSRFIQTSITDGIKEQKEHCKYLDRLKYFGFI